MFKYKKPVPEHLIKMNDTRIASWVKRLQGIKLNQKIEDIVLPFSLSEGVAEFLESFTLLGDFEIELSYLATEHYEKCIDVLDFLVYMKNTGIFKVERDIVDYDEVQNKRAFSYHSAREYSESLLYKNSITYVSIEILSPMHCLPGIAINISSSIKTERKDMPWGYITRETQLPVFRLSYLG